MMNLMDLLVRPERFFSAQEENEPNLKIPAAIALAGAIIAAIAGYAQVSLYTELFSGTSSGEMSGMIIGIGLPVGAFIFFLIIYWIVLAGAFHLISMHFMGSGKFTRTLANTGYGLVPVIIGSIISIFVFLNYLPHIVVPVIRNMQDPTVIQEAMQELIHDPAMMEYTQISMVISILFIIWSANIWIFGVRQARSITLAQACITVIIPIAILIIYLVITMVISFQNGGSV